MSTSFVRSPCSFGNPWPHTWWNWILLKLRSDMNIFNIRITQLITDGRLIRTVFDKNWGYRSVDMLEESPSALANLLSASPLNTDISYRSTTLTHFTILRCSLVSLSQIKKSSSRVMSMNCWTLAAGWSSISWRGELWLTITKFTGPLLRWNVRKMPMYERHSFSKGTPFPLAMSVRMGWFSSLHSMVRRMA